MPSPQLFSNFIRASQYLHTLLITIVLSTLAQSALARGDSQVLLAPNSTMDTVQSAVVRSIEQLGFRQVENKTEQVTTTAKLEAVYPVTIELLVNRNPIRPDRARKDSSRHKVQRLPRKEIEDRWTDPLYIHPQGLAPISQVPRWEKESERIGFYKLKVEVRSLGAGRYQIWTDLDKPSLRQRSSSTEKPSSQPPERWRERLFAAIQQQMSLLNRPTLLQQSSLN